MKLQITAQAYHLRYLPEEDRILFSVSLSSERELGVALTRRLARILIAALAKLVTERGSSVPASAPPVVRDAVLDFQHTQQVAQAVATGTMREEQREKPLAEPARLVREVTISSKPNGLISLGFDNSEQILSLDVAPERLHMVIETFVRMAERAGWDFPPMADWLDPAKMASAQPGKTVN